MEIVLKFDEIEHMLEYAILMRHVVRMIAEQEGDNKSKRVQDWRRLHELIYNAVEAALEHDPNKEDGWVKNHELHIRLTQDPLYQNLEAFTHGRVIENG